MDTVLTDVEVRVLGALVEKELTTPEYYPLSLNALLNACNQKSNRDPVMSLDEDAARRALRGLEARGYAGPADNFDSRVTKYEHRLGEAFNFDRRETAVLCELLIRGPQTPGELRGRCERMHEFDDIDEVVMTLERLTKREPALVKLLPKQPGTKEARYTQLFAGDVAGHVVTRSTHAADVYEPPHASGVIQPVDTQRVAKLELEVATLREEVEVLRTQLAEFKKQFQ